MIADDGFSFSLDGRKLICLDTPGHARHHFTVWDEQSKGLFTGDTFGISYPELTTDKGCFALLHQPHRLRPRELAADTKAPDELPTGEGLSPPTTAWSEDAGGTGG